MRNLLIILLFIAAFAITFFLLRARGPAMPTASLSMPSPPEMYPAAPSMPPIVETPVEDLLAQYEDFLRTSAPAVLEALQPGLSDDEIRRLESLHDLTLPPDLRALYRWHNGTTQPSNLAAFPDHIFVPLDVALADREDLRRQVKDLAPHQQQAFAAAAGHRLAWVGLIVDVAGDGYFFDPRRSEAEGSFFFCFAEDGTYVFYPCFRNYLAAVVEGQRAGLFRAGQFGVETTDFAEAHELMGQFGAAPPR